MENDVVIMRPKKRAEEAAAICSSLRMGYIIAPAIEIEEMKIDETELETEIARSDFIVFMSETAVSIVQKKLKSDCLNEKKIIAAGRTTGHALKTMLGVPSMIPEEFSSRGIVKLIINLKEGGKRVLVLRSARGSDTLREELSKTGMSCIEKALYDITLPEDVAPLKDIIGRISKGESFILPFSSSMMVKNFLSVAARAGYSEKFKEAMKLCEIWAIGEETRRTLKQAGIPSARMPSEADYSIMLHEIASARKLA
jgi:uroporphyrinogen-III synthase